MTGCVDPEGYRQVVSFVAADAEPTTTFIRVPGFRRIVDGVVYAHCPERRVAYVHNPVDGTIRVVGPDESQVKLDTARIARMLVTNELEQRGWVVLHAACVIGPEGGVLVIGNKGAGKTTLSLILSSLGTRALLANDRCLVRTDGNVVQALPWPGSVSIGFGLLTGLGWAELAARSIRNGAEQHPFQHSDVAALLAAGSFTPRFGEDGRELKFEVMVPQLAECFGIDVATEGKIGRVYFPQITSQAPRGPARSVRQHESFTEHVLFGPASGYPNFLELTPVLPPEQRAATAELLRALGDLPAYEVALSLDAARNRSALSGGWPD